MNAGAPRHRGRVLVSGASGLLGRALVPHLRAGGWDVHRLVRRAARAADEVAWAPGEGRVDWPSGERYDAVVHLAGAGIADGLWTARRKREILASRVQGTRTLVAAALAASSPPDVIVSGSATGFYGDTGEREVTEEAPAGEGFLAAVCRDWEAELAPARAAGVRTVALRTALVLSGDGGALARLLPVFRWGLGGPLGDGRQWMSWIARDDWVALTAECVADPAWAGPINAVAPRPVRHREFVATLARVLGRPARLPVPALVLRLALGGLAEETLLASARVVPAYAQARGFRFGWPELEAALRSVLAR